MKNKFRINPILKKEITVSARNRKMTLAVTLINAVMLLIVAIVILTNNNRGVYFYSSITNVFPSVAVFEVVIMTLVIPIMTSGSISGERERQTLDIMLTTPIKPMAIVSGKLYSALATVLIYVITSVPFIAIAFVIGGLKYSVIFEYILMMLLLGIYVGSIGIYSSSKRKNSVSATVGSIVLLIAIVVITVVIYELGIYFYYYGGKKTGDVDILNLTTLALAFNPFAGCVDFMLRSCSSYSLYDSMLWELETSRMTGFLAWFMKYIIPITVIVNLLVSYLFLRIAAYRTVVTKNKRRRKNKKKQR